MAPDRLEHRRIRHAEPFPRKLRAEPRVEHDRMPALEIVDGQAACGAPLEQPLRRIEAREIVQHAGEPRALGIFAVSLRQAVGQPRDAHGVGVAMVLTEVLAYRACERRERTRRQRSPSISSASARSSVASRLRYKSPRRLPAHITTAFSPLSL